ncbi:hypothetical protein, partial [Shimia sp.]|uniref:hypothetical protein n=1 Tax=Shimia sp. TaxID=1954381 RepID=UPI003B8B4D4B
GRKPKLAYRKQLRVIILDLYVAWLDDPDLCVGVSMDVNAWKTGSRYNALHISKKIIPIIKSLRDKRLVAFSPGSYTNPGAETNRTTRIRASKLLQEYFANAKFDVEDIGRAEGTEIIVLKKDKYTRLEYKDTNETKEWRQQLKAYNHLLSNSFIDIPTLEEPLLETSRKDIQSSELEEDESEFVRIGRERSFTRRIFNRSAWDKGGRSYGGWWQSLNKDMRFKITIDNEPVVEADFEGMHVAMLYAEAGSELVGDPYTLPGLNIRNFSPEKLRKVTKKLVLTAINAIDKEPAYQAFRAQFKKGDERKKLKNFELEKIMDAFLARHPCLSKSMFSDRGVRLMRKDSEITSLIHQHFTKKNIPVLSVHDSYLVDCKHGEELKQVMSEASGQVLGRPIKANYYIPGREDFQSVDQYDLNWAVYEHEQTSCQGYLDRLEAFEARTGRNIGHF